MELSGHADDHVVEVGVEVFALGDVDPEWGLEVVAGHDVVDVVDGSGSQPDLGEVGGPDSPIGVLGLVLRVVGGVHVVVDVPVSVVPLLIVVLLEVLVSRVDGEVLCDPGGELGLVVDLVEEQVVLFAHHGVAIAAVSGEHLES